MSFWILTLCLSLAAAMNETKPKTVTLAYIADIHAQLEEHPELFWATGHDEIVTAGGAARIAAAVKSLRAERPGRVLFMDAGDTFQGTGPAAWTEGRVVVPALNALGLDLAIPGNWEVVYGARALNSRVNELHYPTIAENVYEAGTGKRLFPPYLIKELNGVRIAIIGYTDPDVPTRQPPSYSAGLNFAGKEELAPLIRKIREREKPDVLVLLTHIGLPKAVRLAQDLPAVDIVLSGDTHERTYEPLIFGNTWVVEPGSFGSLLGRLDVTVADGRIIDRKWQLVELRADRFPKDPAVEAIVRSSLAPYRERLDKVIGYTNVPLMRYGVVNTSIDSVLADSIRESAGTEIGLSNGFRFSSPIPPGPIREADLWNVYPIVNALKTGEVSGRQLHDFWERELENVFSKDADRLFGGWLPRPSGLNVRFLAFGMPGNRVREITLNGAPIQPERTYSVAACEREGDDVDTVCRIPHVRNPKVLPIDAHEAVRRYLKKHSPIRSVPTPRMIALDMAKAPRSQYFGVVQKQASEER